MRLIGDALLETLCGPGSRLAEKLACLAKGGMRRAAPPPPLLSPTMRSPGARLACACPLAVCREEGGWGAGAGPPLSARLATSTLTTAQITLHMTSMRRCIIIQSISSIFHLELVLVSFSCSRQRLAREHSAFGAW